MSHPDCSLGELFIEDRLHGKRQTSMPSCSLLHPFYFALFVKKHLLFSPKKA